MDGKIRFWHIPEKKVALWNEVEQVFITALCFLKNGKFIACGTLAYFIPVPPHFTTMLTTVLSKHFGEPISF